jgi:hypothetical protein
MDRTEEFYSNDCLKSGKTSENCLAGLCRVLIGCSDDPCEVENNFNVSK